MRKNTASQTIGAQLIATADGSAVTSGTTTVYVTGDGGTQASSGTAVHEGNGYWSYTPSQAETNYSHVAFTFVNSSAISATVQVYTHSYDAHDTAGLGLSRLDAAITTRLASASYTAPDSAATIATAVWAAGTRTLSSFGSLVSDIWANATRTLSAFAFSVTAETVSDKTGYSLTSGERTSIAEALLKLDLSTVTGEAARSMINALRFLRNKWSISGATLTVTKEDDSTSAWTSTITTDSSAEPITGTDPS
jgi:hypothetical protein